MNENETSTETTEAVEEPTTDAPDAQVEESADADPEGSDALGEAGKKALDAMKSKWRTERDKRRELEQRLTENSTPKGDADTDQPAADQIRREALQAANARILKSEVKAAAAGKLADPADAFRFLDMDAFEVNADGEVDADEIADAVQELITQKPYLAAATAKRFQGSGDGGAARKASGPSQLTRADLAGMSPDQIVKAKADGRLANLMSGN